MAAPLKQPAPAIGAPLAQRILARIRGRNGNVVGAGFLLGDQHVMTCAHVLDDALFRRKGTREAPEAHVTLDLPFLGACDPRGTVVAWFPMLQPGSGEPGRLSDIAVLKLGAPVPGGLENRMALLADPGEGTAFRTFGFPVGNDNSVLADGKLSSLDAGGWRHVIDTQTLGYFVQPGFSGAPVICEASDRLLGMVAAADPDAARRLAYAIPTGLLARAWPRLAKPYKELEAFSEDDSHLFFGRDQFTEELVEKVSRLPFLAVIGPSGSGKSSVVKAGMVPRLRKAGGWAFAQMQPRRRPLYQLAHALAKLSARPNEPLSALQARADAHEMRLRADPAAILELAETALDYQSRAERLCLIVDQFEELFTMDDVGGHASERIAEFVAVLRAIGAQTRRALKLHCVVTMRADSTGVALRNRDLAELLRDADVKLGPMSPTELAAAIERPAEAFGVGYEAGLVAEIVTDIAGKSGSLPLLQFALDRLWSRQDGRLLTHEQYDAVGGVAGALADHAEAFYEECTDAERARMKRIFLPLVTLAEPGQET